MVEMDKEMLEILYQIAEYESYNTNNFTRFICPCLHEEKTGYGIWVKGLSWQEIDYRLKMMKYIGIIQSDERKDPLIGISFTCLSAQGRRIMTEKNLL